jgi:hypothetical protein
MAHFSLATQRFAGRDAGQTELGSWEPLGPGNVGGRTKALVIDPTNPNTMYAAAAEGGIWKSVTAGQSWMPLTDSLPTLAMSSLAIDPTNRNTLYAGSGEQLPGQGIFKSLDGGQTWTQLTQTAGFAYVFSIAISPSRPTNIYAATDSGVWSSTDGGATWTNALPSTGGCFSTVVRGDQPSDIVFATCSQPNGYPLVALQVEIWSNQPGGAYEIYRGDMASGNWQMVFSAPNMGPTALAIAPTAPGTIYALATNSDTSSPFWDALLGLYASDQGGVSGSWGLRADTSDPNSITANMLSYPATPPDCSYSVSGLHSGQGGWNLGLAVDPTNSQTLFAAGVRLSRSQDGGRTFAGITTTAHTDFHAWAIPPGYNGASNQTLFVTNDGGVYMTGDALTQAESLPCSQPFYDFSGSTLINGLQVTQFYHGAVTAGGGLYLGGSQDTSTVLGSAAAPSQWTTVYGGDGGMSAFDPLDPNTMYVEYEHGGFARTSDGGITVIPATTGITEPATDFPFVTYFALDPHNSRILYFGGNQLWRSVDGAQTWAAAGPNTGAAITTIAVNPDNSGQVMYGDVNGVIYNGAIYNGTIGPAGTSWSTSQPRSGYVSRIVFDPTQAGLVYATYATFRSQPSDSQVYVSTYGGNTWSAAIGSGLPDIPVHALLIDPDLSSTLYAGTDIGLFVSFDSGHTWAADNSFLSVVTESLQIDRDGASKYLFAFTYGRGAWRVNLTPGAAGCTYAVSPQSFSTNGSGAGLYAVAVNTAPGCNWAASALLSSPYVRIQSPAGGSGPGTLYFMAGGNFSEAAPSLQFSIQDQIVTINQAAASQSIEAFDTLSGGDVIASLPFYRAGGFNALTSSPQDPVHSCTGSADLSTGWFLFTASATQSIDVGSATDSPTVLTVYPMQGSALGREIGCATNSSNAGVNLSLQFDAVAGNRYAIEISGVGQPLAQVERVTVTVQALPIVAVSAGSVNLEPRKSTQCTATVSFTPNTAVRWIAQYGSIDANGNYTAPSNFSGQILTDTVTAISLADPNASASLTLSIRPEGRHENPIHKTDKRR